MTHQIVIKSEETGAEAPGSPADDNTKKTPDAATKDDVQKTDAPTEETTEELTPDQKRIKDQQAEITRLQQKLAKHEKPEEKTEEKAEEKKDDKSNKQEEQKTDDEEKSVDDAAKDALDKAGIDVTPFQNEFNETRDVSEESREKLAKGLEKVFGENAREYVDAFIEGQKSRMDNYDKQGFDEAGGKDKFNEMAAWAAQNMTKEEVAKLNADFNSGDITTLKLAVNSLKASYEKAQGSEPNLIQGENQNGNAATGFQSTAEVTKAMSDPRYKTDPAYRASVAAKMAVTNAKVF